MGASPRTAGGHSPLPTHLFDTPPRIPIPPTGPPDRGWGIVGYQRVARGARSFWQSRAPGQRARRGAEAARVARSVRHFFGVDHANALTPIRRSAHGASVDDDTNGGSGLTPLGGGLL